MTFMGKHNIHQRLIFLCQDNICHIARRDWSLTEIIAYKYNLLGCSAKGKPAGNKYLAPNQAADTCAEDILHESPRPSPAIASLKKF